MKKQTGIWLDSSKAVIVSLWNGQQEVKEIESEIESRVHHTYEGDKGSFMGSTHISRENKFEAKRNQQLEQYIRNVFSMVSDAEALYIFGPAETKIRLKQKIQHEKAFKAEKLKAVEAADSMTMNQIVARVRNFYNSK